MLPSGARGKLRDVVERKGGMGEITNMADKGSCGEGKGKEGDYQRQSREAKMAATCGQ